MPGHQNKLVNFWAELKRRKVVRVIIVYATTAFLLLQLATGLETSLNLPHWFDTVVTWLLIIGFPLAVVLSWIFDVSSKGIEVTKPASYSKEGKQFNKRLPVFLSEQKRSVKDKTGIFWYRMNNKRCMQ